jgi:hypothetical protein
MKKILRKITVLALAATLFVMPASTALAASEPVLVLETDNLKGFDFLPDPYPLKPGGSLFLHNNVIDGYWAIPKGNKMTVVSNFVYNDVLEYRVYRVLPNPCLVAKGNSDNGSFFVEIPEYDEDALYRVALKNNTTETVYVIEYTVFYQ